MRVRALWIGCVAVANGVLACGRTSLSVDVNEHGNTSDAPAMGGTRSGAGGSSGGAWPTGGVAGIAQGGTTSGGTSSGGAGGTTSGGTSSGGAGGTTSGGASSGGAGGTISGGAAGSAGTPSCEPALENCVSPQDENCDGLTPPCTGDVLFASAAGTTGGYAWPKDLAVEFAGEVALVGDATGGIDFGPPTQPIGAAWSADPFIAYFESNGTPRWDALFGDGASQEFVGDAFAPNGDVIATGVSEGVIDFGLGPLSSTSPSDVLVRFTPSGQVVWAKQFSGTRSVIGKDVATTPRGDIASIGWYSGTVDLGGGPFTSDLGYLNQTFVALFDGQGNWIWNQPIAGGDQVLAERVAVTSSGDVVVGGWFVHDIDFGQGLIHATASTNAFVAEYGPTGQLELGRVYQGIGGGAVIGSIAADIGGGWVVAGGFDQKFDVGAGIMTGTSAAFVAKFDASGNALWSKGFDSTISMSAYDVAVDPWGNVLVCGILNGTTSAPLSISATSNGSFVLKLDPLGNVVWAKSFDGTGQHQATLIGSDGAGYVYVVGPYNGSLQLGAQSFTSRGQSDIYVVKLAP